MFRLCFRYLRSKEEAEEVMANGFLKTFDHLKRFEDRGTGSLSAWIRRIMVNECLMVLRKQRPVFVDADDTLSATPGQIGADAQLDAEDLYELIRSLPTGYRTVFNLYVIEGYSHREIAAQFNISENTSKSQLSRARALMQEMIRQREKKYVQE